MATGKVCRSAVFGRVIYPAELKSVGNDTYFLNFTVYVDSLAKSKENRKERKSGKIGCSYVVKGDPYQDMSVIVLANIFNSKTQAGSLAGKTYKSVEVLVEGNLTLSETENSAYYVGLDYCNITITDNNLLALYRAEVGSADEEDTPPEVVKPQLATMAPAQRQAPVQRAPQAPAQRPQQQVAKPVARVAQATRPQPVRKPVARPVAPQPEPEYEDSEEEEFAEQAAQELVKSSQVIIGGRGRAADSIKALLEGGEGEFADDQEEGTNPFTE